MHRLSLLIHLPLKVVSDRLFEAALTAGMETHQRPFAPIEMDARLVPPHHQLGAARRIHRRIALEEALASAVMGKQMSPLMVPRKYWHH